MTVLQVLNQGFEEFLDQGDPRVKNWPMMQTPFPGFAMIVAYIYFVKVAGPQLMKNREPYQLRALMVFYNFFAVFLNLYVFWGIGWNGWFNGYSLKCQPIDYSNAPSATRIAWAGYVFYLTKFLEFSDTIFFVLRKKYNQISGLHVIHHSVVPFTLWFGIKFVPGGHHSFFAFVNSLVHVIMYSYYGLAAMGDKYKKYLFWKKYMTYIQLGQFVVVIIHSISIYVNKCDANKAFLMLNFSNALLFLGLFMNFFFNTYVKRSFTSATNGKVTLNGTSKLHHKSHDISTDINGERKILKSSSNGHTRHRSMHSTPLNLQCVTHRNSENGNSCNNSQKNCPVMTIRNFSSLESKGNSEHPIDNANGKVKTS